ncbi:MAG: IS1 family transposase [Alphaproteobacteria bacterium]|nr:IS1 family transposase [Alphaproteobacteria bacterium]MBR6675535.1 IS1 family transposase [Alphaproteobacteria bacterium]
MDIRCAKCGSRQIVKNGLVFGKQRHKCKECGTQFTKITPAGKPLFTKLISHSLYVAGLSMNDIAKIVGVSVQSISRWIKKWHPAYLADIGHKETFIQTDKENLSADLNIKKSDRLLAFSTKLPSNATFSIVIQLPDKKSLKK